MIVLGLDQAPKGTGWCVGDGSGPPARGYREFADYGDNESALIDHILDWLIPFCKSSGVEAVYTEQIIITEHMNVPVMLKQMAVIAAVAVACGKRFLSIDHFQAEISEWRKLFIGIGKAPMKGFDWKQQAIQACADRGWLLDDHHTAEAVGIWNFGLARLDRTYRFGPCHTFHRRAEAKWQKLRDRRRAGELFDKVPA